LLSELAFLLDKVAAAWSNSQVTPSQMQRAATAPILARASSEHS